jgi:hypothetical protein
VEWNLTKAELVAVTDGGANVVAATQTAEIQHIACFAHLLNLVVRKSLVPWENLLKRCRHLIGHFSHSARATEELRAAQTKLGFTEHKLIQDVITRWNSTFDMGARLVEQRTPVTVAMQICGFTDNLTDEEWETLRELVAALEPMKVRLDHTDRNSTPPSTPAGNHSQQCQRSHQCSCDSRIMPWKSNKGDRKVIRELKNELAQGLQRCWNDYNSHIPLMACVLCSIGKLNWYSEQYFRASVDTDLESLVAQARPLIEGKLKEYKDTRESNDAYLSAMLKTIEVRAPAVLFGRGACRCSSTSSRRSFISGSIPLSPKRTSPRCGAARVQSGL